MAVVGADGCKGGWFAVRLEDGAGWQGRAFEGAGSLWEAWHDAALILLDVPIGLPGDGVTGRQCDGEARRLLVRPRASSVFPVPCRAAVYAAGYPEACRANRRELGTALGRQAWAIVPRIRDVDRLMCSDAEARSRIREIHPEVCFWTLAGGRPMASNKKHRSGFEERLNVLRGHDPRTDHILSDALRIYPRSLVGRDDVLDALAAALTAQTPAGQMASIPEDPQWDARGLRMEMVLRRVDPGDGAPLRPPRRP